MSASRRRRLNADAALRRLLPLLLPPGRAQVGPVVQEALDHPGWARLACERGLGPCFHVFLRLGEVWDGLRPSDQDLLETAYRENLARWALREQVLRELLPGFRSRGIRPVLLKGLAFASELYPDPVARQAGDIDFLVEASDQERIHEQLDRAGFRLVSQSSPPPTAGKRLMRRAGGVLGGGGAPERRAAAGGGEAVYLARVGGEDLLVEVHYHLINLRAGGGKEEVFRSRFEGIPPTRELRLPVGEWLVLDREPAFLHALRHLALHHRFIGFRWHQDLALMLVAWEDSLDPVRLRERCRALNSEKVLDVELALLTDFYGRGILPEAIRSAWCAGSLPWEYPLYRYVARGGRRTPWRELVRTLLAPSLRQQLETLT